MEARLANLLPERNPSFVVGRAIRRTPHLNLCRRPLCLPSLRTQRFDEGVEFRSFELFDAAFIAGGSKDTVDICQIHLQTDYHDYQTEPD